MIGEKKDRSKIMFSTEELWYLFGLYAPTSVIGIENPYTGKLLEEIKKNEQFAVAGLLSRNIIHLNDDNTLNFTDYATQIMIEICLKPQYCFWEIVLDGGRKKIISHHLVYLSDQQMVYVELDLNNRYSLTLARDRDKEAITELLSPNFSSSQKKLVAKSSFTIKQVELDDAIEAFGAGDNKNGLGILSAAGLNQQACKELKSALEESGTTIIATFINNPLNKDQCHIQRLGYLSGKFGGWTMKQHTQNGIEFVNFQPSNAKEFQKIAFSFFQ